jgi:hypothetical protein
MLHWRLIPLQTLPMDAASNCARCAIKARFGKLWLEMEC